MGQQMGYLMGHDLLNKLHDLGIIPDCAQRVIIDINVMKPVKIYVQMFGTTRVLQLDWIDLLKNVEVIKTDDMPTQAG